MICNTHAHRALRLDLLLLTVRTGCPDRDVKKACFRHALTRGRFRTCKVGLILGCSLGYLADFEFRCRRDLRSFVIRKRHVVVSAVIDQFTGGKDFLLRLSCRSCFFRSKLCCRRVRVLRSFRICCFLFGRSVFRYGGVIFLRSFRTCLLNTLRVRFLPFVACLFLCLLLCICRSTFFIGRPGLFRVPGTFHLFSYFGLL